MEKPALVARTLGVYDYIEPVYGAVKVAMWQRSGRPIPPPAAAKRRTLIDVAKKYDLRTLVETGTYYADTVRLLRSRFDTIYSVEMLPELHERAKLRCRKQQNARLLLGDSGVLLPEIVVGLTGPALFWLDAHYSGPGTAEAVPGEAAPIVRELEAVFSSPLPHVIVIDDAREFHASNRTGYPELRVIAEAADRGNYTLTEINDAFHLVPVPA